MDENKPICLNAYQQKDKAKKQDNTPHDTST